MSFKSVILKTVFADNAVVVDNGLTTPVGQLLAIDIGRRGVRGAGDAVKFVTVTTSAHIRHSCHVHIGLALKELEKKIVGFLILLYLIIIFYFELPFPLTNATLS